MIRAFLFHSVLTFVAALSCASAVSASGTKSLDFNRDIRPILSDKCFVCHGPDAARVEGDLRLDVRDNASKADAKGKAAIVPGRAAI